MTAMADHFKRKLTGFTIIELLVIISTLGILVAIGTVAWGGVKTSSDNKASITELRQWKSTFDLYESRFAVFPSPSTNGTYCLGDDFPGDRCGVSSNFSENSALNAEVLRTGALPKNSRITVNGTYLGPYATFTATQIILVAVLKGDSSSCPSDIPYDSASPSGVAYCRFTLTR